MESQKIIKLTDESNWRRKFFFYIVQVGVGANGSYVFQHTAQMLSIFGISARYLIADPDIVEAKNLKNQWFMEKDIGKPKAEVLARRGNSHYKLDISWYSENYIEDPNILKRLFSYTEYTDAVYYDVFPILIGCVDNNYTRQIMHRFFMSEETMLYLDVGVSFASPPPSMNHFQDGSQDKKAGWSGQVIAGLRFNNETILPGVGERFPDLFDEQEMQPPSASCSQNLQSQPQRLLTNRYAAIAVSSYLNELFDSGTISKKTTYFNAKHHFMRSDPIPND